MFSANIICMSHILFGLKNISRWFEFVTVVTCLNRALFGNEQDKLTVGYFFFQSFAGVAHSHLASSQAKLAFHTAATLLDPGANWIYSHAKSTPKFHAGKYDLRRRLNALILDVALNG